MEFKRIDELKAASGLRVVLVAGGPSPWGQAAKAMMEYKGLDFIASLLVPGAANEELVAWTGINSGPVVVYNDERPLERWNDILFLLERLAPSPALVPDDPEQRVQLFGLSHELNGEMGLGWNRRLLMFAPVIESGSAPEAVTRMGEKYNYNRNDTERASGRIVDTEHAAPATRKATQRRQRLFYR